MLRPIGDKIIVKLIKRNLKTQSGIILASNDPAEAQKGRVLAIGNTVKDVRVGDAILPNWQTAQQTKVDDEEVYILTEENVVMIFDDYIEETDIITQEDNLKMMTNLN